MEPASQSAFVLLAIAVALLMLSWVSVFLRIVARRRVHALAMDDALMCLGVVIFTVVSGLIIAICFDGAGLPSIPSPGYYSLKLFMAEIFYHISSMCIKSSIAIALIRVCKSKPVNWALYMIVSLVCLSGCVYILGFLKVCTPMSAMWHAKAGSCNFRIQLGIAYFLAAIYIVIDGTLAILPIYLIWGTKMDRKTRYCVMIVLASAALATCSTMARLLVVHKIYYNQKNDRSDRMSLIVWSLVEEGISITAGSVPMLRSLVDTKLLRRPSVYPNACRPSSTSSWPPRPHRTITSVETGGGQFWNDVPGSSPDQEWYIMQELRFSVHSSIAGPEVPDNVYLGWH